MDIYAVLSYQWELIIPKIQSLVERQVCITRVFFTVIPEAPHLYPEPIDDILFVCIMFLKFKLESSSLKTFDYLYDGYRRFYDANKMSYIAVQEHMRRTILGVGEKLMEKVREICQESPPLSSLARTLNCKSNIDAINYVCKWCIQIIKLISHTTSIDLSTNQVHIYSLGVDANGRPSRSQARKSE